MPTQIAVPEKFELYMSDLDNHLLVENHGDGVVIHASRDNVPERRKASFIRHLAAEGYVPDRYEWFGEPQAEPYAGVRWVVDPSWSERDPEVERRAQRRQWAVTLILVAAYVMVHCMVPPHVL